MMKRRRLLQTLGSKERNQSFWLQEVQHNLEETGSWQMKKEVCLGTMTARLQRVKRYQAYQLTYNFKRWMISRFKARTK